MAAPITNWTRLIGSSSYDGINALISDGNGGIIVVGYASGSIDGQTNNIQDGLIARYDSAGNRTWTRLIGSPSYDEINFLISDGNGGIIVAGTNAQTNNGG